MIYNSVLDLIGNTPMIKINKLTSNPNVIVYAKLEKQNPGGSVKDRIALSMIRNAEDVGILNGTEKIIIEPTSGNTGIGLALVSAVKNYKLQIVMSEAMSEERKKILRAFGAEIIYTNGKEKTDGAINVAKLLSKSKKYFMPDQFSSKYNWLSHYHGTAEEIWKDTKGKVTHIVAGMGTSGTLMGISRRLKEYNKDIKIIGVEPKAIHKIQGLKNMDVSQRPKIYDPNIIDEKINISDENAFGMSRELARKEGLLVGISSGAAMYVAIQLSKKLKSGVIVVILPDGGERYLSTDLFNYID